jgi:hypothetical protein
MIRTGLSGPSTGAGRPRRRCQNSTAIAMTAATVPRRAANRPVRLTPEPASAPPDVDLTSGRSELVAWIGEVAGRPVRAPASTGAVSTSVRGSSIVGSGERERTASAANAEAASDAATSSDLPLTSAGCGAEGAASALGGRGDGGAALRLTSGLDACGFDGIGVAAALTGGTTSARHRVGGEPISASRTPVRVSEGPERGGAWVGRGPSTRGRSALARTGATAAAARGSVRTGSRRGSSVPAGDVVVVPCAGASTERSGRRAAADTVWDGIGSRRGRGAETGAGAGAGVCAGAGACAGTPSGCTTGAGGVAVEGAGAAALEGTGAMSTSTWLAGSPGGGLGAGLDVSATGGSTGAGCGSGSGSAEAVCAARAGRNVRGSR